MITLTEAKKSLEIILNTIKKKFPYQLELVDKSGVYAYLEDSTAFIGAESLSCFNRAVVRLLMQIENGNGSAMIEETPHFDTAGIQLDVSRGGVLRPASVKEYLNYTAAMGLNMFMLYTEDLYEMEKYPFFGHWRGRYSIADLKELDEYAAQLGIEMIPCIQTLGHLEQYLRWSEPSEFRNTPDVLLCDVEETYVFIEDMIKTMRSSYRSKKINLGMDEAASITFGTYFNKFGYQDRFEVMSRHVSRVVEICRKYDFEPMMWSDMYFKIVCGDEFYSTDSSFSDEKIRQIPDMELLYWDYYQTDENHYDAVIKKHLLLNKRIGFVGSIWTTLGYLPDIPFSFESMQPALKACIKNNIRDVYAAPWCDDGTETNVFLSLPGLTVISEAMYRGEAFSLADMEKLSQFVLKTNFRPFEAMAQMHRPDKFNNAQGKQIFYTDLMYNFAKDETGLNEVYPMYAKAADELKSYAENADALWKDFFEYAALVMIYLAQKTYILKTIRTSYSEGNKKTLAELGEKHIPETVATLEKLYQSHKAQWKHYYKDFGWEIFDARYGGLMLRLKNIANELTLYANGKIECIEPLDEPYITDKYAHRQRYTKLISPTFVPIVL